MTKPTITIFGQGRVGNALIKSLSDKGYEIISVFNRQTFPGNKDDLGDLVFLAVQDREIETLSNKIVERISGLKGKKFVHCSGSLDSSALNSLTKKGCTTASFHPLKAVTENDHSFKDVWSNMEGDQMVLCDLKMIAEDLEAHSFVIKPEAKPLLHAAAVVSANYVVTIMKIAVDIAEAGDINSEHALKALLPLMESSMMNIKEKGFEKALTGPIARGDFYTVERHVKSLKNYPDLLSIYKKLGSLTLEIAHLDEKSEQKLKTLLG